MTKVCCKCKTEKSLDQFDRKSKIFGGIVSKCKSCRNEYARYWRRTPKGVLRYQEQKKALKESGYYKNIVYSIKARFLRAGRRAAEVGLEWTIDIISYESMILSPCSYCKLPLDQRHGYGLDRIDNDRGYTLDNVTPCCSECNRIRSDKYTPEEMREIFGPAVRQLRLQRGAKNEVRR